MRRLLHQCNPVGAFLVLFWTTGAAFCAGALFVFGVGQWLSAAEALVDTPNLTLMQAGDTEFVIPIAPLEGRQFRSIQIRGVRQGHSWHAEDSEVLVTKSVVLPDTLKGPVEVVIRMKERTHAD